MFDRRRPDPAQGVFETLLVVNGRPLELEAHLARLEASLAELYPSRQPPDLSTIDVPRVRGHYGYSSRGTSGQGRQEEAALRICVTPTDDRQLEVSTAVRAVAEQPGTVALRSLPLPGGLGAHKWMDRSLLAEAQATLPAGALPLIVDENCAALEASRANVFAVRNGSLATPPIDGRILPGVTRMRVLEIAAGIGLGTDEAELSREDLLVADEVFLTGSVRGIEVVRTLNGAALSQNGEVTDRIAAELRRAWVAAKFG